MGFRRSTSPVLLSLIALAAGLLAVPLRANDEGYSYARIVRLSHVDGDVQVFRGDQSKWEPAGANMPIQQGFSIGTNDGRAEIEFENGGAMWLADHSVLQFTELALSNGGRITKITLSHGTVTLDANLASADSFAVSTPHLDITSGKSKFRVDVLDGGGSVSVFNGKVSVSSPAGSREVEKGQTLALKKSTSDPIAVNHNPSKDDWDRWVDGRATYLANGATQAQKYAETPFSYGMADLSSYGSWNYYPGLGYGWQPLGVGAGWMPFSVGQWGFYGGLGWTWLSAEPWGWVPYHFGSWQFAAASGWIWTPGANGFWNPAPVQWVSLGNRVGWSPLQAASANGNPVRVIVATRDLGHGGRNKVFTADQIGNQLQTLGSPPLPRGKAASTGEGLVVPTATNLGALRSGLALNAQQRIVNRVTAPAALVSNAPVMEPVVRNGALPPLRVPSAPPAHQGITPASTQFASESSSGFGTSRGSRSSSSSSHSSSGGGPK